MAGDVRVGNLDHTLDAAAEPGKVGPKEQPIVGDSDGRSRRPTDRHVDRPGAGRHLYDGGFVAVKHGVAGWAELLEHGTFGGSVGGLIAVYIQVVHPDGRTHPDVHLHIRHPSIRNGLRRNLHDRYLAVRTARFAEPPLQLGCVGRGQRGTPGSVADAGQFAARERVSHPCALQARSGHEHDGGLGVGTCDADDRKAVGRKPEEVGRGERHRTALVVRLQHRHPPSSQVCGQVRRGIAPADCNRSCVNR